MIDILSTRSLVAQGKSFEDLEKNLDKDLVKLKRYFDKWHLTLDASKTVARAFFSKLSESKRTAPINCKQYCTVIANDECPRYLGIKL